MVVEKRDAVEVDEGEGSELKSAHEEGTGVDLEKGEGCIGIAGGGEGLGLRRSLISSLATG